MKKATAKKTVAKKTVAKKTTAKKTTAKKTAAKKSAVPAEPGRIPVPDTSGPDSHDWAAIEASANIDALAHRPAGSTIALRGELDAEDLKDLAISDLRLKSRSKLAELAATRAALAKEVEHKRDALKDLATRVMKSSGVAKSVLDANKALKGAGLESGTEDPVGRSVLAKPYGIKVSVAEIVVRDDGKVNAKVSVDLPIAGSRYASSVLLGTRDIPLGPEGSRIAREVESLVERIEKIDADSSEIRRFLADGIELVKDRFTSYIVRSRIEAMEDGEEILSGLSRAIEEVTGIIPASLQEVVRPA